MRGTLPARRPVLPNRWASDETVDPDVAVAVLDGLLSRDVTGVVHGFLGMLRTVAVAMQCAAVTAPQVKEGDRWGVLGRALHHAVLFAKVGRCHCRCRCRCHCHLSCCYHDDK